VLLQRDTDASQRSAKLALQTAASKKAREEASEMLAAARRLKQEAEEVREAGLQERRRAAAEVLILLHEWFRFHCFGTPFFGGVSRGTDSPSQVVSFFVGKRSGRGYVFQNLCLFGER
jgi:hypothetical protein